MRLCLAVRVVCCADAVGVFSLESDDAQFVFALSIFGDGGNHVPLDLGPALAVAAGLTYTCNGVKVRVNLADISHFAFRISSAFGRRAA